MAVRKNPDFIVWLGDVWHWASRPPGIFIALAAILGATLWYSLSGPSTHRTVAWTPPPAGAPTAPRPQSQLDCPPGGVYAPSLGTCVPTVDRPRQSSTSFQIKKPLPNTRSCEPDYFYNAEYQGCVPDTSFEPLQYGATRKLLADTEIYEALPTTKHYKMKVLLGTISISYSRVPSKNQYVEQGYTTSIFDYAQIQCKDCPAEFLTYEVEPSQR